MSLAGKTILMSGGSRGIGLAIALRAARDGANIALLAKTDTPHPKLEGTVHSAAEQIREAGGNALPIVGDVRNDDDVTEAVLKTEGEFGGIDIVVNNASVIDLSRSLDLQTKKYDLMQDVNVRGTFMLTRAAVPILKDADNPHILSLSPPLNLSPRWLGGHTGYASILKHGVIGRGLNDYDVIFSKLAAVGFKGWVSIEDGDNPDVGMEHLRLSAEFLRMKMKQHGLP